MSNRMKLILIFITSISIGYKSQGTELLFKDTIPYTLGKLLYEDNFDTNLSQWFSEFEIPEKSSISINNKQLDLIAKRGATVWFKSMLSGNYQITYDEVIINEGGECDRVSDMNVFWMATNPAGDFFTMDGKFPSYDLLHLYYAGIGGNNNSTTRFRKYTGQLGNKDVIKEYTDSTHLLQGNKRYKIKIIVLNGRTALFVNNELYFDFKDSMPYANGYFGFRTTRSHQQFDNFKIYEITQKK